MQENTLSVRATVTVTASAEEVWRVLTDLHGYRRWHPGLELLDGPPSGRLAPGTGLRLRANRGTPTEREFEVAVTEVTEPLALAWEGGAPELFFGRHRFTLTPGAEGTSFVDEEVFSGAMAEAVLAEHRATLEADCQAAAEALKKAVEEQR